MILVTGSSGGFGSALSRRLLNSGQTVLGLDKRPSNLADPNFICREIDLSDEQAIRETVKPFKGQIGAVVHAAAEQPAVAAGGDGNRDDWIRAFKVNVLALETIVSITSESLARQPPHRVIAIGSVHERTTSENIAPYAVSKAALSAWVRSASIDLRGNGIAAIAIAVGAMDSPKLDEGLRRFPDPEEARRLLIERLPSGRIVAPEDLAALCEFLMTPHGIHFSGASITFDSGASGLLATE